MNGTIHNYVSSNLGILHVFAIQAAAVDQLNHTVNGTIHNYVSGNLGILHVFAIQVAAVDQLNHTVNGTIHNYVSSNLGILGEGQYLQKIDFSCKNLTFSIVSPKQHVELVIYAEGPCKDLGISPLRVPITFIPYRCPLGFEQNKVIKNECVCICHQKLKK